jgi:two-component system cell cycle sensor histidine kinase/response regulator CckA
MRNHGGTAAIESALGLGTTVSLYLPRASDAEPRRLPPSDPEVRAAPRRRQLLVVDDDGLARRAARRLLERLGYAVVEAPDGTAALRAYRELGPFDVVLLDVAMPGMDGLECLLKLKEADADAHVVMFSSTTSERERTISAGAEAFVPKPLVLDDLDRAISACFEPPATH